MPARTCRRCHDGSVMFEGELDPELCYRALSSRDERFDGRFFVAVKTTGIYCRPICPARTPRAESVTFWPSAAAAQAEGYRPCLRCRPESAPQLAAWRGTSSTVSRALGLLAEGALDQEDVESLAQRLGVGGRQLRRLFQKHLGTTPIAVAQTRRVLFAKKLVHETALPMTEIAHAAGYGSLRRFNDAFRTLYGRPPSELRRHARVDDGAIRLSLGYVPPYDWSAMWQFFAARAIPSVERVSALEYARTIELRGVHGTIALSPSARGRHALDLTVRFPDVAALPAIVARVRRMFDLDADVRRIHAVLAQDAWLSQLVQQRPGLRVPGTWDPFELGVRAILGQQISVRAARALAATLVERHGARVDTGQPALERLFPSAAALVATELGMPNARRVTLSRFAQWVRDTPDALDVAASPEVTLDALRALPGIGAWTAQYVALRALRDPDAFPGTDLGLLRGAGRGGAVTPSVLQARADAWRPWRAYAAQHLWCADADSRVARVGGRLRESGVGVAAHAG